MVNLRKTKMKTIHANQPPPSRVLLLVEHDTAVRDSLVLMLELNEFDVVPTNSAISALRRVRRQKFDAVLMDCELHWNNGIDAIIDLKEHDAELPVIAISANEEDKPLALAAGADWFVEKPIDPNEVLEAIDACTENVLSHHAS